MRGTRYALSIGLCLFVLATLGYYYAYAADERLPSFKLVKMEGDDKEAAALALDGAYNGRKGSKRLTVTADGSEYSRPFTIADNILRARSWESEAPDLKPIRKEHPNFMRGKVGTSGWYRDEDMTVYASADATGEKRHLRLDVELIDERSGKTKRWAPALDDSRSYSFAYAADVQRIGAQIHVLVPLQPVKTENGVETEDGPVQYRDYVLDSADGRLIGRHDLTEGLKAESGAGVRLRIGLIAEADAAAPSEYALIEVAEEKWTPDNGQSNVHTVTTLGERLYSYSYRTGERTLLASFRTNSNGPSFFCSLYGNQAAVLRLGAAPSLAAWTLFDVATGERRAEGTVAARQLGGSVFGSSFIADGRLYALVHTGELLNGDDRPIAAVLDAASGKVLYRGRVVSADPKRDAEQELSKLWLSSLTLRNGS